MQRLFWSVTATAVLALASGPATAQSSSEAVLAEFERVAASVVKIRTVADLEIEQPPGGGDKAARPYSVDGSGIVIGEIQVEGRTEYLVLTNHHVADASNYVLEEGGYLRVNPANTMAVPSVPEASYLSEQPMDGASEPEVKLVELVRRVRGDMTLMRTSGASAPLPVFEGPIGYLDGEIQAGAEVVTSGYPWGGEKITAAGTILEVDHEHGLGLPHDDFVVDLPVEPGQSGGPLFLVEGDLEAGEPLRFRLIGLVHAKDKARNYAVPYELWADSLDEFPAEIQDRLVR